MYGMSDQEGSTGLKFISKIEDVEDRLKEFVPDQVEKACITSNISSFQCWKIRKFSRIARGD